MPVKVCFSRCGFWRLGPNDHPINSKASLFYADHNLKQIRKLIENDENPNYDRDGKLTPFQTANAIWEDNVAVIRQLIQAGADVNLPVRFLALTPLHYAVQRRKLRVTDLLLKSGALINAKDLLEQTPLHHSVTKHYGYPNLSIIQRLLDSEGIDCDSADADGNTALMLAVKKNQYLPVAALLRNGANPNVCNKNLETPLHEALKRFCTPIENLLLLHGAYIYNGDKHGYTPIDLLIMNFETGLRRLTIDVYVKVKILAFKYCFDQDLESKLLICLPVLSEFLGKCYEDVKRMRNDYISSTVTVYDFVSKGMMEDRPDESNLLFHKLVLQRLSLDHYPEYFYDILKLIPRSSLFTVMGTCVSPKSLTVISLVSDWLPVLDIFRLYLAVSNVKIIESMNNLDVREILSIHESVKDTSF